MVDAGNEEPSTTDHGRTLMVSCEQPVTSALARMKAQPGLTHHAEGLGTLVSFLLDQRRERNVLWSNGSDKAILSRLSNHRSLSLILRAILRGTGMMDIHRGHFVPSSKLQMTLRHFGTRRHWCLPCAYSGSWAVYCIYYENLKCNVTFWCSHTCDKTTFSVDYHG